eukprot:scaffold431_cov103-Cylindrotheca_fusiformis.AAC.5
MPSFNILKLSDVQRRVIPDHKGETAMPSCHLPSNKSTESFSSLEDSIIREGADFDPLAFLGAPKGDFELYRDQIQKKEKLASTDQALTF